VTNPPARVLVVEDDPTILEIIKEGLADEGYASTGVTNLSDALAALRAGRYDAILTDALRPLTANSPEDHWHPLAAVRAAAETTPVVIVTAHRLDDYADFRERGFAALLGKPFDLDQLYATVRGVLPR
jgi:DNA-binding response OmpR family regulator